MPGTNNIDQETLDKLKDQIIANITGSINDIVAKAVQNAMGDVLKQATNDPSPVPSFANPNIAVESTPGGPRAFRKEVALSSGQTVDSMIIDITCDNWYTLYVNGFVVGKGTNWQMVQRYSIRFPKTSRVLIAVYAANDPVNLKQAGLIASAIMWDSSQRRTFKVGTDSTWKTSISASGNGFEKANYRPDGSWSDARVEGDYGMAPWGPVVKPTKTDPITGGFSGLGISDAPSAPTATPA